MTNTLVRSTARPAAHPSGSPAEPVRTVSFDRPAGVVRWVNLPGSPNVPAGSAWDAAERVTIRRRDGSLVERARGWALSPTGLNTLTITRPLGRDAGGKLRPTGPWSRGAVETTPVSGLSRLRPSTAGSGTPAAGAVPAEHTSDSLSTLPASVRRLIGSNPEVVVHCRWKDTLTEELRVLDREAGAVITILATRRNEAGRVGPWSIEAHRASLGAAARPELPVAKTRRLRALLPGGGR